MSTTRVFYPANSPLPPEAYENVESVTLSPRETVLLIKQKDGKTTMIPMVGISLVEDDES